MEAHRMEADEKFLKHCTEYIKQVLPLKKTTDDDLINDRLIRNAVLILIEMIHEHDRVMCVKRGK